MSNNTNDPRDGAALRERAVAEGQELRERAVEQARQKGDALGLAGPPTSADAPPAYPAPPYPRRTPQETLPATPHALARQQAEGSAPGAVSTAVPAVDPPAGADEPG